MILTETLKNRVMKKILSDLLLLPMYPFYVFLSLIVIYKKLDGKISNIIFYNMDDDKELHDNLEKIKNIRNPVEYAVATILWGIIIFKIIF